MYFSFADAKLCEAGDISEHNKMVVQVRFSYMYVHNKMVVQVSFSCIHVHACIHYNQCKYVLL